MRSRVNFERFREVVHERWEWWPRPEVARYWYEDYCREDTGVWEFVDALCLDAADSIYQWVEV